MAKGKNVLTTGDVARICNVAPRTVSKWFDKGQLKGYRIPGSKDRRIPVSELVRFMKVHDIPSANLPVGKVRVLVVDNGRHNGSPLAKTLGAQTDYEIETVGSTFEAGLGARSFSPHVMLINLLAKGVDAFDICSKIRENEELRIIKIVALANRLSKSESSALLKKGFDGYVCDSSNIDEVIKKIEEAIAIIY